MLKVIHNGVYREATPEEIAEMERMAAEFYALEPTEKEEIARLKEELKAAKILLGLEV